MCRLTGLTVQFPFVLVACLLKGLCLADVEITDYEQLYLSAVQALVEQRWEECATDMKRALTFYNEHVNVTISCHRKCANFKNVIESGDCATIRLHEASVEETNCLRNCEHRWSQVFPSEDTLRNFKNKVPYDHLQMCYSKLGNVVEAASSAYTFLEHNQGHVRMAHYLKQYLDALGKDSNRIVPLERKKFQELYLEGRRLYSEKKYSKVCDVMETVVKLYLEAEEDCRFLCDSFPLAQQGCQELSNIATRRHVSSLKCKAHCSHELSTFNGQYYNNFFASLFHYLQFSYYHSQNLQKACEATQSYLTLVPDDPDMWHNQAFYAELPESQESWFKARKEVVDYLERQQREVDAITELEHILGTSAGLRKLEPETEFDSRFSPDMVNIFQDEKALNGSRFVADGFATDKECRSLVRLASEATITGDGYGGKESPHSQFESFSGISPGSLALLVKKGAVDARLARLVLDASERVRSYVEARFGLKSTLYFTYTHLVSRTAKPVSWLKQWFKTRSDMSHPVHADNCKIQPNGDCNKDVLSLSWRDYSAILYLNDDFDGGEFVFARNKTDIQVKVTPKCGRAVAFSSGGENLHGVLPVKEGTRCALGMWFTLDPKHKEGAREVADQILKSFSDHNHASEPEVHDGLPNND